MNKAGVEVTLTVAVNLNGEWAVCDLEGNYLTRTPGLHSSSFNISVVNQKYKVTTSLAVPEIVVVEGKASTVKVEKHEEPKA